MVPLDVTSESAISAAVEEQHGRLDVLVNNAGMVSCEKTLAGQLGEQCWR
jgi:NAD(P)-dependent dehydrogenase (short-subunit alcohol dehydrogenase family)